MLKRSLGRGLMWARPTVDRLGLRGTTRLVDALAPKADEDRVIRLASGVTMSLSFADRVQRLIAFRAYERPTLDHFVSLLKPSDVVLDLGAHVGYYALHAAKAVGPTGQVHAFEPEPENYARLSANVAMNDFQNIKINQAAVSSQRGRATFQSVHDGEETGWGSLMLDSGPETAPIQVDVETLDDYANKYSLGRVAAIKMDIQGSELDALVGGEALLRSSYPAVLCELVDVYWGSSQTTTVTDILDFMRSLGYSMFSATKRPKRIDYSEPVPPNVVFKK